MLSVNLKNRKSVGTDLFSLKLIHEFSDLLVPQLTNIFNLSLESGVFPDALKIANVIPIPKTKANLNLLSNYRPISLLSNFSKILETLVASRLNSFLVKYNILYEYKFGFRRHHSTKLALLHTTDDI